MNNLHLFLERLFGEITFIDYLSYFVFINIGIIISLGYKNSKRNKMSCNTPYKFNLKFFLLDNLPRALSSMLICFVVIRFSSALGFKFIDEYGVILGLFFDQLRDIYTEAKCFYRDKIRKIFTK